jgi:nucleoid DNA-binding protein
MAKAKKAVKKVKKVAKSVTKKLSAATDSFTKTQLLQYLAESTDLSKKDCGSVLEALSDAIAKHITKRGVGKFTIPGICKIVTVRKPATKARKGINPFTGEETMFKAKPARTVVKIRPLKKLKEWAN